MKKSNVAMVFMLFFSFLLLFEGYILYSSGAYLGILDVIIIIGTAILWLISGRIFLTRASKENLQKYKEKILKENKDKKFY